MERLSHAARSELRPRRVAQAPQREAPSSHLSPEACSPALLMRAACVLGSARSSPKPESSLSEPGIITCVMVVHCRGGSWDPFEYPGRVAL